MWSDDGWRDLWFSMTICVLGWSSCKYILRTILLRVAMKGVSGILIGWRRLFFFVLLWMIIFILHVLVSILTVVFLYTMTSPIFSPFLLIRRLRSCRRWIAIVWVLLSSCDSYSWLLYSSFSLISEKTFKLDSLTIDWLVYRRQIDFLLSRISWWVDSRV